MDKIKKLKHHMSKKMRRMDPNDSDVLREFTRKIEGKPYFKMPEGTYKNVGGKYIRQESKGDNYRSPNLWKQTHNKPS